MKQLYIGIGILSAFGLWMAAVAARRNRLAKAAVSSSSSSSSTGTVTPASVAFTPAASSTPSAGAVAGRSSGGTTISKPSAAAHAPASSALGSAAAAAGAVAPRTDKPVASPAGTVAGRTDEPVSQFEVSRTVAGVQELQPNAGALAETVVERSLSTERRVRPIPSRFPSECPGWLGAVLNYGALVQTFFTHYLDKHGHMSFDFDVVHTDNYSSIIYDEPTEYEVRTAPDSVPKLWFHTWKEPPPPCAGLISDKFVNWRRDLRGSVASRRWEADRGIWFDWDCWGLWKLWPTIICYNHPLVDRWKMQVSWGEHSRGINFYEDLSPRPSGLLAAMSGDRTIADQYPYWREVENLHYSMGHSDAYYPTLPLGGDKKITANRELAAIPTDNVVNASWADPGFVGMLDEVPIALNVANWNDRLILGSDGEEARGRWKDRFILKDIRPLINDGTLPYTWDAGTKPGDWVEQIKRLNSAYNYLLHGRWIVWATLMYALAYHRGNPAELPGWWVNFCSAWAIPVPRADRKAKSVSVEGGLSIDKDNVSNRFHGSYPLEKLLRTCAKACPMPGSVPISEMQKNKILTWKGVATGQYRPPVRWVRGWWSYRISKEDIGTNWADIIIGAVQSIAASAASTALDSVLDVAVEAIDAALDQLPDLVGAAFSEFVSRISSRLVTFAGNLTKGYVEDFDLQSDLMPAFEAVSQYGSEKFFEVTQGIFGGTQYANNPEEAYRQMRQKLETALTDANDNWGYIADLFGTEADLESMLWGDIGTTDVLYEAAQKFGKGTLY